MRETTQDTKDKLFPVAFFLDANILRGLPHDLVSGEFSQLMSAAQELRQEVLVPAIVWQEYCHYLVEQTGRRAHRARDDLKYVEQYWPDAPDVQIPFDEVGKAVPGMAVERLRRRGLKLLPAPNVNIEELTARAVRSAAPFRSANRGFKDELLVLSMLEYARGSCCATAVLISGDSDFKEGELQLRFEPTKTRLRVVKSLEAAHDLLSGGFDDFVREMQAEEQEEVRRLAKSHWHEVSDAVIGMIGRRGYLDSVWSSATRSGADFGTIKRILRVEPLDLSFVRLGAEDPSTGRYPVTLGVRCEFEAAVESYSPRFRAGVYVTMTTDVEPIGLPRMQRLNTTFEDVIALEATVERSEGGKWGDFKLSEALD